MSKDIEIILFQDLARIIDQGKNEVTRQVNSTIAIVFWQVGYRINTHILNNQRAEYVFSNCADSVGTIGENIWSKF